MQLLYGSQTAVVDTLFQNPQAQSMNEITSIIEAASKIIQVVDAHPFGGLLIALLITVTIFIQKQKRP